MSKALRLPRNLRIEVPLRLPRKVVTKPDKRTTPQRERSRGKHPLVNT